MIETGKIELLIPLTESDCKEIAKACEILDKRNEYIQFKRDNIDKSELIELFRRFTICLFMIDPRVATYSKNYKQIEQVYTALDNEEHDVVLHACKIVDNAIDHSHASTFVEHLKDRVKTFSDTFNRLDLLLREYHDSTTEATCKKG